MKILLIEDEVFWQQKIKEYVKEYDYTVTDGRGKIDYKDYSIFLIDIDLGKNNGIEIAKQIRKISNKAIILFISAHENFVFDVFDVKPLMFVRKANINTELPKAIKKATMEYQEDNKTFTLRYNNEIRTIRIREIQYVEIYNGLCEIHTKQTVHYVRKTIKSLYDELSKKYFIFISKSVFVNMYHINSVNDNCVYIEDEKLDISRRNLKKVKDIYYDFLTEASL